MVVQLRRRIDRKEFLISTEVTIKTIPGLTVIAHRTETSYPAILDDIPTGFEVVMSFLAAIGVDPVGTPFTVYHQVPDADAVGDIAMCVPVAAATEPSDHTEVVEMAGGAVASIVHRGGYDDMNESYGAVAAWIHERGHRIVGPHREVYLNSPADVAEEDLLTEVLFPIDADGETMGPR